MFPTKSRIILLLTMSLTFGALLLVNLDRQIHIGKDEVNVRSSRHGWPLAYLERIPTELEFRSAKVYSWPLPAVANEERVFSWMNFTTDFIVAVCILGVVWFFASLLGQRLARKPEEPQMLEPDSKSKSV